jgi:2-deoxy-D-gluconate 3-dehydrogenase
MAILQQFSLQGKTAIVTGATRGIGQAIAVGLAEAGAQVVGVGSKPDAPETRSKIQAAGGEFHYVQADLSNLEPIPTIIAEAKKTFGSLDILVNNAGIIRRQDSLEFSEDDWDSVMNVNLKSVFFLSQAVAKEFVAQKTPGKIINIASLLSFQGGIRIPSYTSSKSGLKGLTMLLANEWAKYGICVNGIAPGYIETDNTEALRNDPTRSAEILGRIPAGRWGDPQDLAGAAVFLASPASNYVNGFTMAVDGGWLGR